MKKGRQYDILFHVEIFSWWKCMNRLDYIIDVLKTVKYAKSLGVRHIDKQSLKMSDVGISINHELFEDSSFFDHSNIILNNFDEELNSISDSILSDETIISDGIVFTPVYLSKMVISICKKYINETRISLAGDISSGMGAFIYGLNSIYPDVTTQSIEKNELLYKLSTVLFAGANNRIINADTLKLGNEYNGIYDLIVGNPPYVRLQNIDKSTKEYIENNDLYKDYLFGSYDLSVAFIIKIIELLKEDGVAGLVLTRKMFTSAYGKKICEYLKKHTQILEIIDFGDNQMFQDKTTYTLVVVFRKKIVNSAYSFSHCLFPTLHDIDSKTISNLISENARTYQSDVLDGYPWDFSSVQEKSIISKFETTGCNIQEIFKIVQGFRTGDNKAFIVKEDGAFIRPYVDGKSIGRGWITNPQKIIWPYKNINGCYSLIEIDELLRKNEDAYKHLEKQKKSSDNRIHEYSRPQNLYAMDAMKIFVKEMMPRAEFAADYDGNMCFSSGYALIPKQGMSQDEMKAWTYVLSTDVMEYQYRLISTNLHSGWFRMYKGHIEKIMVPKIDFEQDEFLSIIKRIDRDKEDLRAWLDLNKFVATQIGVNENELESILDYLNQYHSFSLSKKKSESEKSIMSKKTYVDNIKETAYPELTEEERSLYYPVELTKYNKIHVYDDNYRTLVTFQNDKKAPIQRWYRYTQGYSTLLVQKIIDELKIKKSEVIFDPFCGSGTTLLTAKNNGISSIGCDVSPLSCWIAKIKTHDWNKDCVERISNELATLNYGCEYNYQGLQFKKFFEKAFYPEILAQTMHIRNWIAGTGLDEIEKDFLRLALVSIQEEVSFIRKHGSHYRFLNDDSHVGVNKLNIALVEEECDVTQIFKDKVNDMLNDIMMFRKHEETTSAVYCSDILKLSEKFTADAIITSPPYLNRNNYFSQQKIELSLLDLIASKDEYNKLVKQSFCSHVEAELPSKPVSKIPEVNKIIDAVTKRKSNNAKIPHMIAGYFDDIDSFFRKAQEFVRPGSKIAFVVANCRWNGVVIPVDHLVCRIAEQYGFTADKIIVARMKGNSPQQMQAYGKIPVRESIVFLSYK